MDSKKASSHSRDAGDTSDVTDRYLATRDRHVRALLDDQFGENGDGFLSREAVAQLMSKLWVWGFGMGVSATVDSLWDEAYPAVEAKLEEGENE